MTLAWANALIHVAAAIQLALLCLLPMPLFQLAQPAQDRNVNFWKENEPIGQQRTHMQIIKPRSRVDCIFGFCGAIEVHKLYHRQLLGKLICQPPGKRFPHAHHTPQTGKTSTFQEQIQDWRRDDLEFHRMISNVHDPLSECLATGIRDYVLSLLLAKRFSQTAGQSL